jgi:hypothetical protein
MKFVKSIVTNKLGQKETIYVLELEIRTNLRSKVLKKDNTNLEIRAGRGK